MTRPRSADLTARARIRDAAIRRFAAHGFAETNLKDIAADAGVSIPLITHHFGSKDGLRVACDEYLAALINEQKNEGISGGMSDPLAIIRDHYDGTALIPYLVRTLADGSPHVDELIDRMVEDAMKYMKDAADGGMLEPHAADPEVIKILTIWQFGAYVMHRHVKRLLGIDLIDDSSESIVTWSLLSANILSKPMINPEFYASSWMKDAYDAVAKERSTNSPQEDS